MNPGSTWSLPVGRLIAEGETVYVRRGRGRMTNCRVESKEEGHLELPNTLNMLGSGVRVRVWSDVRTGEKRAELPGSCPRMEKETDFIRLICKWLGRH